MSTTDNSFVSQLLANADQCQDDGFKEEYCARVREEAAQHFLSTLLASDTARQQFETNALHRSRLGSKTVRLTQWQGRGPTHLDQALSDLLDLGDLLQKMQDYLDETYGSGQLRV